MVQEPHSDVVVGGLVRPWIESLLVCCVDQVPRAFYLLILLLFAFYEIKSEAVSLGNSVVVEAAKLNVRQVLIQVLLDAKRFLGDVREVFLQRNEHLNPLL